MQFCIWDVPGQVDFSDQNFDPDMMFGRCDALIFVIDAQVTVSSAIIVKLCL